ncbi:hypothetical protein [Thermoactinomyces sp. CICC 10520]|uniref:hypothetical protein n=1 Tax=Thermoactinomyces sp. CICC 10520 TaxID=2767433 RepID=UPI0018DC2FD7|nr:hypothetical protein [Thermoactinomyces sp. CICC 10520]MBH8587109.1 hypothetical protein [Thermoactinomyces sp. CICC 10520]
MENQLRVVENEQEPKVIEYVPSVAQTVDIAAENLKQMYALAKKVMRHGVDYDTIPGTPKPSLLKPGAERLLQFFGLGHKVTCMKEIEDWENGFFYFHYKVTITHPNYPGFVVAECEGSANSKEKKYRNQDPYSIVNTLQKMAIKRALVGATLQATGASGLFTQDVEDMDLQQPAAQPVRKTRYQQSQVNSDKPASDRQIKAICALASSKGLTAEERDETVKALTGKDSKKDLTASEASQVIEYLQQGGDQ